MARSTWALSDELLVEHMRANIGPSAKHWLFHMLDTLPHYQFTRFTVTLWAIWSARRKAIHEDIFQTPLSTHGFINSYLEELQIISRGSSRTGSPQPRAPMQSRWVPPPTAVAKVNVDAAVSKTENRGVAAAFCRDSNGNYLGSSAVVFEGISNLIHLRIFYGR